MAKIGSRTVRTKTTVGSTEVRVADASVVKPIGIRTATSSNPMAISIILPSIEPSAIEGKRGCYLFNGSVI